MGINNAMRPLANEQASFVLGDERGKTAAGGCDRGSEVRQLLHLAAPARSALAANGAVRALRRFRSADQGAQFHERLVQSRTWTRLGRSPFAGVELRRSEDEFLRQPP